ncbi:hypothetical protein G7046_g6522 [Stylonectria norvegica]|nr:hypothetical protein G7046_g6522 [Stylonectria norvegica]
MSLKPTLVLVPGAWHRGSTWNKVVPLLEAQQYKCVIVALPSASSNPDATFLEDIEAVRNAITASTCQGRDVVLVVHSYGGAVAASAIKGLARNQKEGSTTENKSEGAVIGMAMMASGFIHTGVSFLDGAGGKPPPSWKADTDSGFAVIVVDPRQLFYHDLPEDEGNYWTSQLEQQALKPLTEGGEHAYAGWKDVPVWFLETIDDQALPIQVQQMLVQHALDSGADVTVREIETSHSPMLSKPAETADFILEASSSFVEKKH